MCLQYSSSTDPSTAFPTALPRASLLPPLGRANTVTATSNASRRSEADDALLGLLLLLEVPQVFADADEEGAAEDGVGVEGSLA